MKQREETDLLNKLTPGTIVHLPPGLTLNHQGWEGRRAAKYALDLLLAFGLGLLTAWSLTGCAHVQFPPEVRVCSAVKQVLPAEVRRVMDERGTKAITIGKTSFFFEEPDECLRVHERVHREQYAREGAEFLVNYAAEHKSRGYEGNRYEVEARAAQAKCEAGR